MSEKNTKDNQLLKENWRGILNFLRGQSLFEFVFAMAATVLLIVGMVRLFIWTGRDLADRRKTHERMLVEPICGESACPLRQIRPKFFFHADINRTAINSDIFITKP